MLYSHSDLSQKSNKKVSEKWIERFESILEENLNNPIFTNKKIADELGISVRQLSRRLKGATSVPPRQYIRDYRLRKAKRFMEEGRFVTVKETAHAVGFVKVGYFIQRYNSLYGKRPLEVLRENGWR